MGEIDIPTGGIGRAKQPSSVHLMIDHGIGLTRATSYEANHSNERSFAVDCRALEKTECKYFLDCGP